MKYGNLQHWDIVAHFKLDYFQGQITKYVMRWRDKGGIQDLEKAAHFLEKYIEICKADTEGAGQPPEERTKKLTWTFCADDNCPMVGAHIAHTR